MHDSLAPTVARLHAEFGAAPQVAVVLGSGWRAALVETTDWLKAPYGCLPAFPATGVAGHAGSLAVGTIAGQRVAMLCGRAHTYETGDCAAMAPALRSLALWGVQLLVLTCAAGSLRPNMPPGSLMLITDHINAPQRSPLVGAPGNGRFVDMTAAYDLALRRQAIELARATGQTLHEGTYLWALGPQFETPAEIRMFAAWGADAVGMSVVPETIAARHAGLRVAALALITNMAAGLSPHALSHAATLAQADASGAQAAHFLTQLLASLAPGLPLQGDTTP